MAPPDSLVLDWHADVPPVATRDGRRVSLAATLVRADGTQQELRRGGAILGTEDRVCFSPDSVRGYVRDAMAAFRARSVHRAEVDWQALEDSVVAQSAGAQTPAGTWRALTWALRSVDPHSFLLPPPDQMAAFTGGMVPSAGPTARPRAAGGLLDGRVGAVAVSAHTGANRPAYVDSLQRRIGALDRAGACGWVVDLRENTGGNMWSMLAGVGPLLGAEVVGSFTSDPPGAGWHYRDGRSWSGDGTPPPQPLGWASAAPRRVRNPAAPVALLIGRRTSSSGELTLVAFLGRPHVRSFGDSTGGQNSVNANIPLRDGATLVVTSAYPRDRLGRPAPLRVAPDELVPAGEGPPNGAGLADAAPLGRAAARGCGASPPAPGRAAAGVRHG